MRLIDADELIEHVWRDRLDSRELIANLVESMPTIEPQPQDIARDIATIIENEKNMMVMLKNAQPERTKVKWIKKMKVTETDTYTSYDPEWYCPQCGTKYDPYFAQKVNFCCVCGSDMRGEQDAVD